MAMWRYKGFRYTTPKMADLSGLSLCGYSIEKINNVIVKINIKKKLVNPNLFVALLNFLLCSLSIF